MRRPSGDQDGHPSKAELLVRRAAPEPSAFIAYISQFPSLFGVERDAPTVRRPRRANSRYRSCW